MIRQVSYQAASSGGGGGEGDMTKIRYDIDNDGIADKVNSYIHNQVNPTTTWNVTHNRQKLYPNVRVVVGGEEVSAEIKYCTINVLQVLFPEPESGTVFVD